MTSWIKGRLSRSTASAVVLVIATIATSSNLIAKPPSGVPNPRDLSSLVVHWSWQGKPDELLVHGAVTYVRSGRRLVALRVRDGAVLWDKALGGSEWCIGAGPVIVDDDVVVSFAERVFVLDATTGDPKQTVTVTGNVTRILGPPLTVVTAVDRETEEVTRIDPRLGQIRVRRNVGRIVYDSYIKDGVLVLNADEGHGDSDDQHVIVGLDAEGLVERWRFPAQAFPEFVRMRGEVYLHAVVDHEDRFSAIDSKAGTLGKTLPQRSRCDVSSSTLPWDLELTQIADDDSRSSLRRDAIDTGRPIWEVDLPCVAGAWLTLDRELLIDCRRGGGRSTLMGLDWASGKLLRQASGFRDVRSLHSQGELIIAETEDGVVAFDAQRFGPPEKALRSLPEEVHRILAIESGDDGVGGRGDYIGATVVDLRALGSDALPHIAKEIPHLGTTSLIAAAEILEEAQYKKAAASLAARLKEPLEEPGEGWDAWNPQFAILTALARIGSRDEVALVGSILTDPKRKGTIRRQALATLASIASPEAVTAIDRFLTPSPRPTVPWWSPPSPQEFAGLVGLPDIKDRADRALGNGGIESWHRLKKASESARAVRPDGTFVLVFPDSDLGGPGDLWIAETDARGAPRGPARFGGVSIHTPGSLREEEIAISASVDGDLLTIHNGTKDSPVSMTSLDLDSDGDGLPDVVERRLRTDPERADTDSDGSRDSQDLAPNARLKAPASEEQAIATEVFRQFFMFEPREQHGLAIVVTEAALEWAGRGGPTISLSEDEDERFLAEAGYDGIAHIRIKPLESKAERGEDEGGDGAEHGSRELRPDERSYSLDLYRGGLNAIGYRVIVRKIGPRWVIADLRVAYVS